MFSIQELTDHYNQFTKDELLKIIQSIVRNYLGDYTNEELMLELWHEESEKISREELIEEQIDETDFYSSSKDTMLECIVEHYYNKQTNEFQKSVLDVVNIDESIVINYSNIEKIFKNPDKLIVKSYGKLIKYDGHNPSQFTSFNGGLNEIFVATQVTNKYEGFVKVNRFSTSTKPPKCIKHSKICSVIEEDLLPGVTLYEWIRNNITSETFSIDLYNILFTVFKNLYKAHSETGFTHYDLHTKNLIISADNIPTIIDFDFSYINYKGMDCGKLYNYTHVYNKPMWMHDIFKLSMSCLDIIRREYMKEIYPEGDEVPLHIYVQWPYYINHEKINGSRDIILLLNMSINLFLIPISKSLRVFGDVDYVKLDHEEIGIHNYLRNFDLYCSPTKLIQNCSEITFEDFLEFFENKFL